MSRQISFDFSEPLKARPGCTLLPIRPRPLEDEILSSWVARSALSNGLTPRQVSRHLCGTHVLAEQEIDRVPPPGLLSILSQQTGISQEVLAEMTLEGEPTRVDQILDKRGTSAHAVCNGYLGAEKGVRRGIPYCPDCLSEDPEPYFRRAWRYSFVTACPKHKRLLIDCCEGCQDPMVFLRPATADGASFHREHLGICQRCGFNNAVASNQKPAEAIVERVLPFQEALLGALRERWMPLNAERHVHAVPWFSGLKLILRFINTAGTHKEFFAAAIAQAGLPFSLDEFVEGLEIPFVWPQTPLPTKTDRAESVFEHRSIRTRAYGLAIAENLLNAWPHGFNAALREDADSQNYWRLLTYSAKMPYWVQEALWDAFPDIYPDVTRETTALARAYLAANGYAKAKTIEVTALLQGKGLPKYTDEQRSQAGRQNRRKAHNRFFDAWENDLSRKKQNLASMAELKQASALFLASIGAGGKPASKS